MNQNAHFRVFPLAVQKPAEALAHLTQVMPRSVREQVPAGHEQVAVILRQERQVITSQCCKTIGFGTCSECPIQIWKNTLSMG
jgi:hypothetical protein